ncbi:MAG: hypothetical protein WDN01_17375 [Rhizomicrobium sp.]
MGNVAIDRIDHFVLTVRALETTLASMNGCWALRALASAEILNYA